MYQFDYLLPILLEINTKLNNKKMKAILYKRKKYYFFLQKGRVGLKLYCIQVNTADIMPLVKQFKKH